MSFIAADTSVLTRCPLQLAQSSHEYGAFSSSSPRRPATLYYRKGQKNVEHKLKAFNQNHQNKGIAKDIICEKLFRHSFPIYLVCCGSKLFCDVVLKDANSSTVSRFPFPKWFFWMEGGASSAAHISAFASGSFVDKTTEELNATGDGINVKDDKKDEIGEKSSLQMEGKMINICDKLIVVFMVDKPKASDWRRLLVFSKEWCKIRPHFFNYCKERAEMEDDPGKKQNLLRLGRKLKEIDEDVQRQDELLAAIREKPSEISEIIAKRRNDFTTEFFEHFLTVAESYYKNKEEQSGKVI